MSQKIKTVKLSFGHHDYSVRDIGERTKMSNLLYRVEEIRDTTEFFPGQTLTKKEVDEVCAAGQWRVTMVGKS